MAPHLSSWSDLPKDLLHNIADRLGSCIYRLWLRAVCRSWRFHLPWPSSRPPRRLPFPMGPSRFLNPTRCGYFNLVHYTIYCLQPLKNPTHTSKCWLIGIEETQEFGKIRLKDPLSLPVVSQTLSPCLPKRFNLLDYRFSEITRVYDLQFVDNKKITEIGHPERLSIHAKKVAVCAEGPRFAVMAIHSAGRLSIWKDGDPEWRAVVDPRCVGIYSDVVYHYGKFYARGAYGVTISVDLLSESTTPVSRPEVRRFGEKRLLSHLGDLFLIDGNVDLHAGMITRFQVHRLNEDELGEPVRVNSLGNRALFVGDGCSFGVLHEECGGDCKMNCIYYIDTLHPRDPVLVEIQPFQNVALFDMDDYSTEFLSRVFGYSWLFWPPPSWVLTWRG